MLKILCNWIPGLKYSRIFFQFAEWTFPIKRGQRRILPNCPSFASIKGKQMMAVLTDEAGFHIKPDSEVHQVQTWTRFYKKNLSLE